MNKQQTLLIVLGISLLLSIILLSTRMTTPARPAALDQDTNISIVVTQPEGISVQNQQAQGRLLLEPATLTVSKGESIIMNVLIDAPGKVLDGADAFILYDPQLVNVSNIANGEYFAQLPQATVDQQNGIIKVTGFSRGKGTSNRLFFSFTVSATKPSQARFHVEYEPGRSDLSTLVERGTSKNILTGTTDAVVQIRG